MESTVIWLGESKDNIRPVDLAEQDSLIWPHPVPEFYDRISVYIRTVRGVCVESPVGRHQPERREDDYEWYHLRFRRESPGIAGIREVRLIFTVEGRQYAFDLIFAIEPAHLTREQFNRMLDDISHWVFSSLGSPVREGVDYTDRSTRVIRSQQAILDVIEKRINEAEITLQSIANAPRMQTQREYLKSPYDVGKQDSVTMRWLMRNPEESNFLIPRTGISYDVYENRFILFFLDQLKRRLSLIQCLAQETIAEKGYQIRKEQRYSNNGDRVEKYNRERREAEEIYRRCIVLINRLDRLRNLEFLQGVNFDPRQFSLQFSLALTQDFHYGHLFAIYQQIGREEGIQRLDRIRRFKEGLASIGLEATSKIYEYWIFFAVCTELIRLHFHPIADDPLLQAIDQGKLVPEIRPGSPVTLIGDRKIYGDMRIDVYYEKEFGKGRDGKPLACPDVTLEIWRGKALRGRLVFDAKYKDYTAPVTKEDFHKDQEQVSRKYQDEPTGVIRNSLGAFLLHVTQEREFENYGAFMKTNGFWIKNGHRYGFVPVVPGNLKPLRTLLAMLFMVKLQADVDICWVCGSTDIQRPSQSGTIKENKRVCQVCGHEWWMSECGCGFPLPKGEFSFVLRHRDVDPKSKCPGYFCPGCGKCFCGVNIAGIAQAKTPPQP
jgi:hypothetical protein